MLASKARTALPVPRMPLAVATSIALTAVGVTILALSQAGRAWDGAQFAYSMIHNGSFFTPWDRWTDVVWELPARLAAALTGDVDVALWAFCIGFAAAPLAALLLCWYACTRIDLFAWGAVGICAACLPGQWFVVAEGQLALQLGWPLLLAVAAGLERRQITIVVLLVPLVMWQHPFAAAVFLGAASLVLLAPRLRGATPSPNRLAWAVGFIALVGIRLILIHPQENSDFLALIENSTSGFVKPALALLLLGAAAMLLRPRSRTGRLLAPGLFAAAGLILAAQASSASFWGAALDYRATVLFVTAPIGVLMVLDLWRRQRPAPADRARVVVTVSAAFALVLAVQARAWRGELDVLASALDHGPQCRTTNDVSPWWRHGPLEHWSTPYNAVLEQGETPNRLVLANRELCKRFDATGEIRLSPFGPYAEPPGEYRLPAPRGRSYRRGAPPVEGRAPDS